MIEETIAGPGNSTVEEGVVGNFTGAVRSGGAHEVVLESRIDGVSTWEVVRTLRDTDPVERFRGFEPLTARKVDYRYRVVLGANVAVWLQG